MPILIKEEKLSDKSLEIINQRKNKTKFVVEAIEFYIDYLENSSRDFVGKSVKAENMSINNDEVIKEIEKAKIEILKELSKIKDVSNINSSLAETAVASKEEDKELEKNDSIDISKIIANAQGPKVIETENIKKEENKPKDNKMAEVEQNILNSIMNIL